MIWLTWCGKVVCDLRPGVMRKSQRICKSYASAGDQCPHRMRIFKRYGDGNGVGCAVSEVTKTTPNGNHGSDNRCLKVFANANCYCLTVAKALHAGNRDHPGAGPGGTAEGGAAGSAHTLYNNSLTVGIRTDDDLLTGTEVSYAGNLDIDSSGGC